MGGLGYLISLGVGLFAGVERKRRDLSLLRLIGLVRRDLMLFPLVQAGAIALAGAVLAAMVALGASAMVNGLSLGNAGGMDSRAVCVIAPSHLMLAAVSTLAGAVAAALFAGRRAARILPAEGLRDG